MITITHLFEARLGGYWNYRVPGILCTSKGTMLVTAEARRGTGGDWDGNDILLRRSPDGISWETFTVMTTVRLGSAVTQLPAQRTVFPTPPKRSQ